MRDLELRILHEIACKMETPFWDTVANYANEVWPGVLLFVLALLVLALKKERRPKVARVLLAGILALGVVHGIRAAVWAVAPRDRPAKSFTEDQILRGVLQRQTCEKHPEMWVERGYPPKSPSFPSSHTITAASLAAVLGFAFPWLAGPAWLLALAVGWARLYTGKHWPSDVVGSLLLSALVGWVCWHVLPRLQALVAKRVSRRRSESPVEPG